MVTIEFDVPVAMRDGTRLFADVYRPADDGAHPVLLQRTPYDKSSPDTRVRALDAVRAAQEGYAVVIQDVRGRYASEGEFYTFVNESTDGYDTVEWAAAQSWSNGRVGMYGGSYVGATQWLAALAKPPHLAAIAPTVTSDDYYEGWTYQGGAFQLNFALSWALGLALFNADHLERRLGNLTADVARLTHALDHFEETARHLPLEEAPAFARNELAPYYRDWVAHPEDDDYWRRWNISRRHHSLDLPALHRGGWYDIFLGGTLRNFTGMRAHAPSEAARTGQRLLVGPWFHNGPGSKIGEVDFGVGAAGESIDVDGRSLRFFERWLTGDGGGRPEEAPIDLFVMGTNEWRQEWEWPLARTRFVRHYLHSAGRAQTLAGDGGLDTRPPGAEPPDVFVYNPRDPVPTRGGGLCCHDAQVPFGAFDQREVERRPDVLVYTSAPLDAPVEVTGPVTVTLYAASSAPDTDFTAKLVDAGPCGRAINLSDGIVRARYRNSTARAEPISPGAVYEYRIDLWATGNVFLPGHRIRLEISSSNFPRFDRNPNTGAPAKREEDLRPAMQTILHNERHPSHLTLPIIPRR